VARLGRSFPVRGSLIGHPIVLASVSGTLSTTDAADAAALVGTVADQGTLAATESADISALSGNTGTTGTLGATETQDVAAFTTSSNVSGTFAATEAPDNAALSGNTGASGTLAAIETADSAALAGSVFIGGVFAATETADSLSFSGNIGASGPFIATDTKDSASFAGAFIVTGTFAATESPDVLTFSSASVVTGTLSTSDNADAAAFVLTAFPPNYNPLERLKMYTGTLGSVSNREDWIVNISFVDDNGDALDISSAQSIGTYICRQGCPNSPVLSATLSSGIILTDNFTIQWAFSESDMENLCPEQYDVFCRVQMDNITTQILSANVAIIEGGPRQ